MTDIGRSQRDAIKQMSPPWLSQGVAEKILYAIGLSADAVAEKMNEAARARMPGTSIIDGTPLAPPSALPLIGADRVMGQGPNESNADFAIRLQKAFDTWQRAGSSRSILQQVLGYVATPANVQSGQVPIGAIVGSSSTGTYAHWDVFYNTSDTSKPPHHQRIGDGGLVVSNWNWDGTYTWWQSFLVLYFPIVLSTTTGTTASITSFSGGFATLSGITGVTTSSVGQFVVVSGASSSANNGTFQIAQYLSPTAVLIANSSAVTPDANNGAITWTIGSYPAVGPQAAWGTPGRTWGQSGSAWGVSVSSAYIAGLRSLVRLWKTANSFFPWIIISFAGGDGSTGLEFSPNSTPGAGNPDGTWATWAKRVNGVSVRARDTSIGVSKFDAFCDGTAIYQQCWVPTGT